MSLENFYLWLAVFFQIGLSFLSKARGSMRHMSQYSRCREQKKTFQGTIHIPANINLFKVNNRNARKWCEICSKLTINTPERRQWRHPGVFIVNFEHISHFFSTVSIVDFEQANVCWDNILELCNILEKCWFATRKVLLDNYFKKSYVKVVSRVNKWHKIFFFIIITNITSTH